VGGFCVGYCQGVGGERGDCDRGRLLCGHFDR
jgi:hypothetical protein